MKRDGEKMNNGRVYFNTLKYIVLGILSVEVIYKFFNQKPICVALLIFIAVLIINDLYRIKYLQGRLKEYYISLLSSIIGAGILIFFVDSMSNVMIFFTLIELIAKDNIEIRKPIIYIHATAYFLPNIIKNKITYGLNLNITNIIINILIYSTILTILFLIRSLKVEKEEIIKLNEELKERNLKLKDYAEKVEELTVSKERNRVAQELHDSIGHSLMAISMHLDFLRNIVDKDIEKAQEVLIRTDSILQESIKDLRDTVYKLKENNNSLESKIRALIRNITISENININVGMDKDIEKTSTKIKEVIFVTIKESITNSLKHGYPSKLDIKGQRKDDKIYISIEDDGKGCGHIVKSHGLNGIEDRILSIGGTTTFKSGSLGGFKTEISIPIN